jgi:hypothetical protein
MATTMEDFAKQCEAHMNDLREQINDLASGRSRLREKVGYGPMVDITSREVERLKTIRSTYKEIVCEISKKLPH